MKDAFTNTLLSLKEKITIEEQKRQEWYARKKDLEEKVTFLENEAKEKTNMLYELNFEEDRIKDYPYMKMKKNWMYIGDLFKLIGVMFILNLFTFNFFIINKNCSGFHLLIPVITPILDVAAINLVPKMTKKHNEELKKMNETYCKYSSIEEINELQMQFENKIQITVQEMMTKKAQIQEIEQHIFDVERTLEVLNEQINKMQDILFKSLSKIENKDVESQLNAMYHEEEKHSAKLIMKKANPF